MMQLKIDETKDNPLLKRKELIVKIYYEGSPTPSKNQIIESISKQVGADQEKIEVVKINGEVGMQVGKALVYVWEEKPKKKEKKKKETKQQEAGKKE
ncbi:MAG: hypothetical protein QXO19_03470 [Candidatus Aenigmatarchaeota archaeon]